VASALAGRDPARARKLVAPLDEASWPSEIRDGARALLEVTKK
jgi:hypothetical protein